MCIYTLCTRYRIAKKEKSRLQERKVNQAKHVYVAACLVLTYIFNKTKMDTREKPASPPRLLFPTGQKKHTTGTPYYNAAVHNKIDLFSAGIQLTVLSY